LALRSRSESPLSGSGVSTGTTDSVATSSAALSKLLSLAERLSEYYLSSSALMLLRSMVVIYSAASSAATYCLLLAWMWFELEV